MARKLKRIFGANSRLSALSLVWILAAAYIFLFSLLSVVRYCSFITNAWDLGEFSQSMWTTLHGGGIFQNNVVFDSEFHVHFRPIMFLLLPIYAIFESPLTLLVLQSILIGLAAVPLYWIAKQELKSKIAIVFPILYLLYPALAGANLFDFHPETFVPLFIFLGFFYYKNGQFGRFFLFMTLALTTKEDVSLVVIFLGLYLLILNRKSIFRHPLSKEVSVPLATSLLGVLWLVVSLWTVQYFLQTSGYARLASSGYVHAKNVYGRLGGDQGLLNVVKTILTNPTLFLQVLFSNAGVKLGYLLALFLPVAFLSFFDFSAILFLPTLLSYLLADSPNYYSIFYQYPSLLIPGIFIAAIYGMKRLRALNMTRARYVGAAFILVTMFASLPLFSWTIFSNAFFSEPWFHSSRLALYNGVLNSLCFIGCLLVLAWAVTHLLRARALNLRRLYKHSRLFLISVGLISVVIFSLFPQMSSMSGAHLLDHHDVLLSRIITYISANASVLTQADIFPQVSNRLYAYAYYNMTNVDYILIDKSSFWYTYSLLAVEYQLKYGPQPPFPQYVDKLIESRRYGLLAYGDQIFLYERGYHGVPIKLN